MAIIIISIAFLVVKYDSMVKNTYSEATEARREEDTVKLETKLSDPKKCCLCGEGELGVILTAYTELDGISVVDVNSMGLHTTGIDLNEKYVKKQTVSNISNDLTITSIPLRGYCSIRFDLDEKIDAEKVEKLYCNTCLTKIGESSCKYLLFDHKTSEIYPMKHNKISFSVRDFTITQNIDTHSSFLWIFYTPEIHK